ncbi:MAG: glycosyltransferase [Alphaproteobacteria bacterium]|nr:glycosyltransferase [Alphaproteobacteria bacterium]
MKVLLASFDPVPAPKGASRHILRNHAILAGLGHEVSLLTLGTGPAPGLRHIALDPPGDTWLERAVRFHHLCKPVLEHNDFDVVHVRSPFEGLAVPPDIPVVYEVNALYSVEIPVHYPDLMSHPGFREQMRNAELLLLDRAEQVITPSPTTARYLEDLGVPGAVVVPNCPSIAPVARRPHDGPVRIVYIGTLASWQGLHQALRCLGRLRHLEWTLDVLTGTSRSRWVEKLADKQEIADRVRILDPLEPHALGPFLAQCDIGLAPLTPSERNLVQGCMPVKLLDYMRAGLAVLAPDIDVVTHVLGRDVPLYRAWSRTSLTETLEAMITSDRTAWSHAMQARVQQFDESVQERALAGVYATFTDSRSGRSTGT